MAYTERKDAPFRKRGSFHRKKKVCVFCGKDNAIDYKDTAMCLRAARSFPDGSPAHAQLTRER